MIQCRREMAVTEDFWNLYQVSFSETEKIPRENLQRAMDKGAALYTYYDDGFVGLTYQYTSEDRVFFIYLATDPEKRNKGYGVRILDRFREINAGKRIFLVLEPCDPNAEDYDMRVRRSRFYQRNGGIPTGIQVISDDYWFDTMFIQGELTAEEMDSTVREYEDIHNGRV